MGGGKSCDFVESGSKSGDFGGGKSGDPVRSGPKNGEVGGGKSGKDDSKSDASGRRSNVVLSHEKSAKAKERVAREEGGSFFHAGPGCPQSNGSCVGDGSCGGDVAGGGEARPAADVGSKSETAASASGNVWLQRWLLSPVQF